MTAPSLSHTSRSSAACHRPAARAPTAVPLPASHPLSHGVQWAPAARQVAASVASFPAQPSAWRPEEQDAQPQARRARARPTSPATPSAGSLLSDDEMRAHAERTVRSFFMALNARDMGVLLNLVTDGVVLQDLSHDRPTVGQLALARFYSELLASLTADVRFVVEECAAGDHKVAVMWRMECKSATMPYSCSGVSFFGLDLSGRIAYIRQAPEHLVKGGSWTQGAAARIAAPVLNMALPQMLGGVASAASTVLASTGMFQPSPVYRKQLTPPAERLRSTSPAAPPRARPASSSTPAGPTSSARPASGLPASQAPTSPVRPTRSSPMPTRGQPVATAAAASSPAPLDHTASPPTTSAPPAAAPPASTQAPAAPAAAPVHLSAFNGLWTKDPSSSDVEAYERALDVWGIHGPQRATARLIEGMEIKVDTSRFSVHFLTPIPYFKVTEAYSLEGSAKVMRRDMRPGSGNALLERHTTGLTTRTTWGAPQAGSLQEVYEMSEDGGSIRITSTITVGTRTETTHATWQRPAQGMTREQLLKAQEKQHGSASSILRGFGLPV